MSSRLLNMPGSGPTNVFLEGLSTGPAYIGTAVQAPSLAATLAAACVTVLLIVRLAVRREGLSWAVLALLFIVTSLLDVFAIRPATINPYLLTGFVSAYGFMVVWLLRTHGVLAYGAAVIVNNLITLAPWTLDLSRWYAWRQFVALTIIATLIVWGFRNVLGKQSAFPAGALDG